MQVYDISTFTYFLVVSFIVQSLLCYAPKLEWVKNVPIFLKNKFEIVTCNTGLQRCVGGCTHCMTVDGSFVAKSCAGEHDITLEMLGIHADGCKNITEEQNSRYAEWLMDSIGRQMQLQPNFTRVCRCSWNGCNGIPAVDLMQMPNFIFQKHANSFNLASRKILHRNNSMLIYLIIITLSYFIFHHN